MINGASRKLSDEEKIRYYLNSDDNKVVLRMLEFEHDLKVPKEIRQLITRVRMTLKSGGDSIGVRSDGNRRINTRNTFNGTKSNQ